MDQIDNMIDKELEDSRDLDPEENIDADKYAKAGVLSTDLDNSTKRGVLFSHPGLVRDGRVRS